LFQDSLEADSVQPFRLFFCGYVLTKPKIFSLFQMTHFWAMLVSSKSKAENLQQLLQSQHFQCFAHEKQAVASEQTLGRD